MSMVEPASDLLRQIDAQNDLAWGLRFTESERAHGLATEIRKAARQLGYAFGQATAARTMAMTIADQRGLPALFELAEEARRLFDEAGDGPGRAASRDFLASLFEHIGDLAGGLEWALDALSIAREIGVPTREAYALSSVGGILAASGEIETAVLRLQDALRLFEGLRDQAGCGTIYARLCRISQEAGRTAQAMTYADRCREIAEAIEDQVLRSTALSVMGECELANRRPKQAEALLREALDCLPTELGRNVMGTNTQISLGKALIAQGTLTEAEVELRDALRRSEENAVSVVSQARAHETIADLHELRQNYQAALEHLRRATALRTQISQGDARNKLAQIEVRATMEAAKKDADVHKSRFVALHSMQSKLLEAEKMALLGKLAAGTAHELNTPLGVLQSNIKVTVRAAQRLTTLVQDSAEHKEAAKLSTVIESCVDTSQQAVDRIAAIAVSFKRFTQVNEAERQTFDLIEGLQGALALLSPTLPDRIQLESHLSEVPAIDGWPKEVNHALFTVLQNAVEAIEGPGTITVRTRALPESILIEVRDDGRGMSQEQATHLFDVAWSEDGTRTKMRLGLSAAYATLQKHGGTMSVQSQLAQGTSITFVFPLPSA